MKSMKWILLLIVCLTLVCYGYAAQETNEPSNAQKAITVLESLQTGSPATIHQWINPNKYIQHNLNFPNGREVLLGALDQLKQAGTKVNIQKVIVDGDNYIQHNPGIADGLSGLGNALSEMAKQGITMKYDQIHMVIGEGNFVLVMSEGTLAGKHSSFYDLFRIENGKIAEHWDVIETIPSQDQWKNQNGKF